MQALFPYPLKLHRLFLVRFLYLPLFSLSFCLHDHSKPLKGTTGKADGDPCLLRTCPLAIRTSSTYKMRPKTALGRLKTFSFPNAQPIQNRRFSKQAAYLYTLNLPPASLSACCDSALPALQKQLGVVWNFPRNGRPPSGPPKSRKYRSSFRRFTGAARDPFPVPGPGRRSRIPVPCRPHFPFDGSMETSGIPPALTLKSEQIAMAIILHFFPYVKLF